MADSNGADREPLTRRELLAREAALLAGSGDGDGSPDDGASPDAVDSPADLPADGGPSPDGDGSPDAVESPADLPPSFAPASVPARPVPAKEPEPAAEPATEPAAVGEDDNETAPPAVVAPDDEADADAVGEDDSFAEEVLGLDGGREWTLRESEGADSPDEAALGGIIQRHRRPRDVVATILGGVGELLVTAGVLLGLFVVWQIWWTDVKANQHTDAIINEMALPEAPLMQIPDEDKQTGPAPMPEMPEGAYAVLRVPSWGTDYMVPIEEGVGLTSVLHQGLAGHYPETQAPGQIGNFALAGHRQSHGAIFLHVDQLQPGDAIIVETADTWYVYTVTDSAIVAPTEVEVIAPVPGQPGAEPTTAMITLTTCHPLWSTAERFVVHGELSYWAPHDSGTPAELEVL